MTTRLLVLMTLLLAASVLIAAVVDQQRSMRSVEREQLTRISAIASTVATSLDGDRHGQWAEQFPDKDAFTQWRDAPRLIQEQRAILQRAQQANDLPTPIYTLRTHGSVGSLVERTANHTTFLLSSAETPYWQHTYDWLPEMAPTLEGRTSTIGVYETPRGQWVSAYAPILGSDGSVQGIVEVDVPVGVLVQRARAESWYRAFSLLGGGALMIALSIALLKMNLRSLNQLAEVAAEFDKPIHIQGPTEITQLASVLETARRAVEKAEADRSRFFASASHELRTPLNAVLGYTELLMDDFEDESTAQPDLARIHSAATMLLQLVDDLLLSAKLDSDEFSLHITDVDIDTTIREAVATTAPLARRYGNQVALDLTSLRPIRVDRIRILQVLNNLLANAHRFTAQGDIRIRAWQDAGTHIDISDTGVGMTTETLERVFLPFHQASGQSGGTGLGLPISQQLCERMGGRLTATSELGVGSTFSIWLPE